MEITDGLFSLISRIKKFHKLVSDEWSKEEMGKRINTKKILVCDVYENKALLKPILAYKSFLDKNIPCLWFSDLRGMGLKVETRVKTQNSIESKIAEYTKNKSEGKIPLKKCLNDIMGIRVIVDEIIFLLAYKGVLHRIEKENMGLKCINSSKNEYVATHIYFKTEDNYSFQWELQMWNRTHEQINRDAHKRYKQKYTKWEENVVKKDD
jgi:hypothetical protein